MKIISYFPIELTYRQLIEAGVHVGHSRINSSIFCSWMVIGFRQDLLIIDLYKFMYMLRIGLSILEYLVRVYAPIWFINLDASSDRYIKFPAMACGEMWVSTYWVPGMLSNYFGMFKSYKQMYIYSNIIKNRRHALFDTNYSNWIYTRFTWPRAIFVSNVFKSYLPCREALSLQVPCLGIVDTNAKAGVVTVAIPGNDESIESLVFYNTLISNFIMYKKFRSLYVWFSSIRGKQRLISFKQWFMNKYGLATIKKFSLDLRGIFRANSVSKILRGSTLFFSQSYWLNDVREKLLITYSYPKKLINNFLIKPSVVLPFFQKFQTANVVLANYFFLKHVSYNFFKRKINRWYIRRSRSLNVLHGRRSLTRNFNLMRVYSRECSYLNYNSLASRFLRKSKIKSLVYKFVNILLIFSFLRNFIFFSSRFYRYWPTFWKAYYDFQYPYYALKNPFPLLRIPGFKGKRETRFWNRLIKKPFAFYNNKKYFKSKKSKRFFQLPANWFSRNANPNLIFFLNQFLGFSSLFPFFNSSTKTSNLLNTKKLNWKNFKRFITPYKSNRKFNKLNINKGFYKNNVKTLSTSMKADVKKISLKKHLSKLFTLIGYRNVNKDFSFSVGPWSFFWKTPRYCWFANNLISNSFLYAKKLSLLHKHFNPASLSRLNFSFLFKKLSYYILNPRIRYISRGAKKRNKNFKIKTLVNKLFLKFFIIRLNKNSYIVRFFMLFKPSFKNFGVLAVKDKEHKPTRDEIISMKSKQLADLAEGFTNKHYYGNRNPNYENQENRYRKNRYQNYTNQNQKNQEFFDLSAFFPTVKNQDNRNLNYKNQDNRNQDNRNLNYKNQDNRNQDNRNQDNRNPNYKNQDNRNQDNRNPNYKNQDNRNLNYKNQDNRNQDNRNLNYKNQDNRNQDNRNQDNRNQDNRNPNYKNQDNRNQDNRNQNYKNQNNRDEENTKRNNRYQERWVQDNRNPHYKNQENRNQENRLQNYTNQNYKNQENRNQQNRVQNYTNQNYKNQENTNQNQKNYYINSNYYRYKQRTNITVYWKYSKLLNDMLNLHDDIFYYRQWSNFNPYLLRLGWSMSQPVTKFYKISEGAAFDKTPFYSWHY